MITGNEHLSLRDKLAAIYVVIPVYNSKAYLHRCIDSFRNSDFQNHHLICVDDGSTDGSGKLLDELASQDSRMTVIHQKNTGVSAARNAALELLYDSPECRNAFVTFTDSDDYVHPQYLSILIDLIKKNKLDCCICSYERIYKSQSKNVVHYKDSEVIKSFSISHATYSFSRIWGSVFLIEDLKGLFFQHGLKWGEDCLFIVEYMYRKNRKVGISDLPLYKYVFTGNSAICSTSFEDYWTFIEDFEQLVRNLPPNPAEKPLLLRRTLRQAIHICYDFRFDKIKYAESQKKIKGLYCRNKDLVKLLPQKERIAIMLSVYSPALYCCYRVYLKMRGMK